MPSGTPYALLQASVNGGAVQTGIVTVYPGDSVVFSGLDAGLVGARSKKFELYEYPDGLAQPSGWSTDGLKYYYAGGSSAPPLVIPADLNIAIGKYLPRLLIDGGVAPEGRAEADYRDESLVLVFPSPDGIEDTAYLEGAQFDADRPNAVAAFKANWRRLRPGTWGDFLGDAAVTITVAQGTRRAIKAATLTTARIVTLGTSGALKGHSLELCVPTQGFNLGFTNGGGGGGTDTITASSAFVRLLYVFDGTNWDLKHRWEN